MISNVLKQFNFVEFYKNYCILCRKKGKSFRFYCKRHNTHNTSNIEYVLKGELPATYKPQVQGQLWISEREWCDFVSYDPRIPHSSRFFCTRVYRDEKYIKELETKEQDRQKKRFVFQLLKA